MNSPLVSVLITVFNREQYIAPAIESVLNSSYGHFELIIVDDCSTDGSVEVAREYEQKDRRVSVYVNKENLGDYRNRNQAASYARGKYIKYLDADDMLYDYGLDVMVRFTEQFSEAGFGLGCFPDDDRPFPVVLNPHDIYLEGLSRSNHFDRAPGSALIKTEVFRKVGGFSGKRMIGDYEFWLKISRYYSMVKLPLDLYWNRIHAEQESKSSYANANYGRLRKEVLEDNLRHPDCPLNVKEIKQIRKNIREQQRKERVLGLLSKAKKIVDLH